MTAVDTALDSTRRWWAAGHHALAIWPGERERMLYLLLSLPSLRDEERSAALLRIAADCARRGDRDGWRALLEATRPGLSVERLEDRWAADEGCGDTWIARYRVGCARCTWSAVIQLHQDVGREREIVGAFDAHGH